MHLKASYYVTSNTATFLGGLGLMQSLDMSQMASHSMSRGIYDSSEILTTPEAHPSISVRASAISAQMARIYPVELRIAEKMWRDRYHFFKDKLGLVLRPRYHPDWKPSWIARQQDPLYCEDAIAQVVG